MTKYKTNLRPVQNAPLYQVPEKKQLYSEI